MSRLSIPTRDDVPAASREHLDGVHRQFGVVPAAFRLIGTSPAILGSYLGFASALDEVLDIKTRERIAIAIAQLNGCDYCLSAHRYISLNTARLSPEEIERNRQGRSSDPRSDAAVRFAVKVLETRGHVADDDIADVRSAGFSDAEIVQIVAVIAHTTFTNLLNSIAQTHIDFPVLRSAEKA